MKFVYVLEDDPKFMSEIVTALLLVDPTLQIRQFSSLDLFSNWIKFAMLKGPSAVQAGGVKPDGFDGASPGESEACTLQMIISKVEFLGARQLGLMKKTRELFIRLKICTAEDPTAFVLTAFEDPAFKLADLKDRILTNILIKPFDRLILQQHLTFALDGRHPPSKHAVAPYKTNAIIEVLKTIELENIGATGFATVSNRELPIGAIAKYYARAFMSDRQRSLIAKVVACESHPQRPGWFLVTFSYFGIDPTQISNIRKYCVENKSKNIKSILNRISTADPASTIAIHFVEDRDEIFGSIEPTLKRKIQGAKVSRMRDIAELMVEFDEKKKAAAEQRRLEGKAGDALPSSLDFLFVSHRFVNPDELKNWEEILGKLKARLGFENLKCVVVSTGAYTDAQERELARVFDDLYYVPIERVYIIQKMLLLNPRIGIADDPVTVYCVPHHEIIKSARPVQIDELSEAGLVMHYDRDMSLGSFREFILWQPYEIGAPEINATCNFVEPGAESGEWKLHFVFFAMKDVLLKAIRQWIMTNYALSKEKEG